MGLFGSARVRDQALANPQAYQPFMSPQIGEAPSVAPGWTPPYAPPPDVQGESFFRNGGAGQAIAGSIGDFLLQRAGMKPIYQPMQQWRQQQQYEDAQWTRRHASELADQKALYQFQQEHKAPTEPPDVIQLARIANDPSRPEYERAAARDRIAAMNDPVVTTPLPGDRIYSGPRSGLGAALGGQLPTAPVGKLTPLPGGQGAPGHPFDAIVAQESGGRAGVQGPQTPYGRAQGMAQLLPSTAKGVAEKHGIAWRPDLMTATTPEGAQYQRGLGELYFNEGLQATGNVRDAARYYFGGPNRKMWGPKTNAYADAIMARIGS